MTEYLEQGERLNMLMNALNLTQVTLAQMIELSQGYVSQLLSGKRRLSRQVLQNITKNIPNANVHWLMTGVGDMLTEYSDEMTSLVLEPDAGYHANPSDPLSALRELLEDHNRRISALEARVEELMRNQKK